MILRKSSVIKRFLRTMFRRLLVLLLLTAMGILALCIQMWVGRDERAIVIEVPENAPAPPARSPDTLRVLTYNIAHARGPAWEAPNTAGGDKTAKIARLQTIGSELRQLGLDLIFLQEVDFNCWWSEGIDQAAILAEAAGFPYIVRQRTFDTGIPGLRRVDCGNILLSRLPVEDARRITLAPYSSWEPLLAGNQDALLAQIRISTNDVIRLIGAHLDPRNEDIRVEAAEILLKVQRESARPLILLGTLHSTPPRFPESETSRSGQNTIELLESFGILQRRPKRGQASHLDFTYPTAAPRRIVDWILPDTNWQILDYRVLRDLKHSDHLPVLTTLKRR